MPATRMRDVADSFLLSHPTNLQVAPHPEESTRRRRTPASTTASDDRDCHPSHYVHFELLSVERFNFIGREVQVAAVPLVQVGGRVVVDDDGDVRLPSTSSCTDVTVAVLPRRRCLGRRRAATDADGRGCRRIREHR